MFPPCSAKRRASDKYLPVWAWPSWGYGFSSFHEGHVHVALDRSINDILAMNFAFWPRSKTFWSRPKQFGQVQNCFRSIEGQGSSAVLTISDITKVTSNFWRPPFVYSQNTIISFEYILTYLCWFLVQNWILFCILFMETWKPNLPA